MSSNDFSSEQPSPNESIPPAPPDFPPARSISQPPRWPHPNFWWSLLWCLLFMFITQIPGAVVAALVAVGLAVVAPEQFPLRGLTNQATLLKSEAMSVGLAVGMSIIELTVVGFSLLVIRLVVGPDWRRQLAVRRPSVPHALLVLASLPALMLLGNVAYSILKNFLHLPSLSDFGFGGMEEMVEVATNWPWGFAVLVIGLGPGIGEELWCRGFLGRGLVGNYGVLVGVLATSFFFGLIHLDPCQGTMAMMMGLWLHFVYLTTRSLWLPMLLHFLNNSLSVLGSRVPHLELLDAKPNDIPLFVYAAAGLLLAAAAYALYQSRAHLEANTPDQLFLWRPAYEGVEYPPADSGTHVVHPMPSILALALVSGGFGLFVAACVAWIRLG